MDVFNEGHGTVATGLPIPCGQPFLACVRL